MTSSPPEITSGTSRRDLLTKGLVVGGVLWATPALQTLGASPAAASGPCPPPGLGNAALPPNVLLNTQFTAVPVAGSVNARWSVAWPVVPSLAALAAGATVRFTWRNVITGTGGSGTLVNQAQSPQLPGTSTPASTFVGSTIEIQLLNVTTPLPPSPPAPPSSFSCVGPHGYPVQVTAEIICGGNVIATVCRRERVRWDAGVACAGNRSVNTIVPATCS